MDSLRKDWRLIVASLVCDTVDVLFIRGTVKTETTSEQEKQVSEIKTYCTYQMDTDEQPRVHTRFLQRRKEGEVMLSNTDTHTHIARCALTQGLFL